MELLEKRVKSRFSHRQIWFYPPETLDEYRRIIQNALSLEDGFQGVTEEKRIQFNQSIQVSLTRLVTHLVHPLTWS